MLLAKNFASSLREVGEFLKKLHLLAEMRGGQSQWAPRERTLPLQTVCASETET